ncbi:GNAT family N-acetyltransferase [Viridibacillus sp. YIM B01967]|uniref:GNAT family N-acetyltransferase n=1 Tax=Viridibacillus soli TaxID=2798301 RepID=A0ABS1H5E8_9BACL|nr:GNAT family N-acetyltransferase [Viridibacillus soli]MBK3494627.1 GNAT family N-acetyltransferase [Viridibacillus soli]
MKYTYFNGIPNEEVLMGIQGLHQHVFEGAEIEVSELQEKSQLLCCVALEEGSVAGFKLGYELETGEFYSWLGGVHMDYRGQGIATHLMELQHKIVKEKGYETIRTIGRNHRRAMLILNIKYGFNVIETFTSKKGTHKIVLEKAL